MSNSIGASLLFALLDAFAVELMMCVQEIASNVDMFIQTDGY
jgi:hypothetical protein